MMWQLYLNGKPTDVPVTVTPGGLECRIPADMLLVPPYELSIRNPDKEEAEAAEAHYYINSHPATATEMARAIAAVTARRV